MKKIIAKILAFVFIFGISILPSFAAQDSTVMEDNAPIRLAPQNDGKILEYIPVGSEVRISSHPMEGGWYKIRSKTGMYGWVHEKFLSVQKPKKSSLSSQAPVETEVKPERDRKWFLRVVGGFDFFSAEDINSVYNFSDIKNGYSIGGELGLWIAERVALAFRSEAIIKDMSAIESTSNASFNLSVRSYPVMGGFDFYLSKLPALRLSVGIFGGKAFATSFSSEASSLSKPNIVVLQQNPFTGLVRLNLTRPLGRILSVSLEMGYRFLRTEGISTEGATNIQGGPQIFARDGTYKPRAIDLSGVIIGAGVGVHF